jgi:hypothetical protein
MKRAFWLMTLAGAGLFAGCGGGNAPETPIVTPTVQTPSKLSKAQFIKQGDGICAEVNAALGTLSTSATDAASASGQRADLYQGMIERLRGLGTPDDQTGLDQFFSAGDNIVSAEKKAQQAAASNDSTALASADSEAASAESTFSSAASSYGFKQCGQGATTPSTAVTTTPSTSAPAAPVTPATPAPAPTAPAAPTAPPGGGTSGTGTGTSTGGGSTGTGSAGTSGGSGGVGPG